MSVITTEKDYTQASPADAGYFRIGFVTLRIPPEDIDTSRVVNNESIHTIRGMNEMFRKTGQARWDVTVSWNALLNDASPGVRYQQWEDLINIVAIFKAAPFVEVESLHLRQLLAAKDPGLLGRTKQISMGLRQLRIDSHPDIVDGLKVTLTMTYFNCAPYTQDFSYVGDGGSKVAAYQSSKFQSYIATWRRDNMDRTFRHYGDPTCQFWQMQAPGAFSFKWREYLPVMTGQFPEWAKRMDAPASIGGVEVPPHVTPRKPRGRVALPPEIEQIINNTAPKYGLDPAVVKALCFAESSGDPNAHTGLSSAKGLFQLIDSTARSMGVSDPFDPQQATDGGCRYLAKLKTQFGSYEAALAAYLTGPACVSCYLTGTSKTIGGKVVNPTGQITGGIPPAGVPAPWADAPAYVSKIMGIAQSVYGYNSASSYNPSPASASASPAAATGATSSASPNSEANPVTVTDPKTEAQLQSFLTDLQKQGKINDTEGWLVDHRTDPGGVGVLFLYKEHQINLGPVDLEFGNIEPGLWPMQFSVLFVNNLAQIPLAAYQYPTYQHVGPCSSVVKVSFISKGDTTVAGTQEPVHEGLISLTSMAHNIEQQYQRLKTQFRSVQSVHRMQAIFVENQVLNMLGLSGLMIHDVTTQTLPESADMVAVQLSGSQYENKFENLTSYRINAIGGEYTAALQDTALNSDKLLEASKTASPEERSMIGAALDYRGQMGSADENALAARLLTAAKQITDTSPFTPMQGANVVFVSETDADALCNQFISKASSYPVAVQRVQQLKQAGQYTYWTIADYLMFKEVAYEVAGASAVYQATVSIDQGIRDTKGVVRQSMVRDAYSRLFPYFAINDVPLRNALNVVMDSPTLGKDIKSSASAADPALANSDHGAYRDMGLNSMVVAGEDFNPGMYFVNTKTEYQKALDNVLPILMADMAGSTTDLNTTTSEQHKTDRSPVQAPQTDRIVLSESTSIPGNAASITKMLNIPGYSMAEAFPTYKLFFMEDSNSGIYYAFDNFYSYAAVTDIEIQRPYNRPATMRLKLMNLTHLLNHKLFDASLAGKWEASLTPFANSTPGGQYADVPSQQFVYKSGIGGASYQLGRDNTEGFEGGDMANRRIPLQYFPLQTGTKIQLRLGFTNNPDQLTPVFQGEVTEIEGNEVLTVTAQSYLLELATQTADKMQTDGWFHVGSMLENTVKTAGKLLTFWVPGVHIEYSKGPAYGGVTIFGDSGDVGSVMGSMLKAANASHFGHWQINQASSPLLKGFGWKELVALDAADGATLLGSDNVARALQNVYDRSAENIMVDTAITYDGSIVKVDKAGNSRSWMDQRESPWSPASYYVDGKTEMTVWDLMQDVSRRYPEYVLLEKWYGYPYSCDSTLVYGHPLDWYRARPIMFGDTEQMRSAGQNDSTYRAWWKATGEQMFRGMLDDSSFWGTLGLLSLFGSDAKAQLVSIASQSFDGLKAAGQDLLDIAVNGYHDTKNAWVNKALHALTDIAASLNPKEAQWIKYIQTRIQKIEDAYVQYLTAGKQHSTDLLKPIRRYHFIDHQSIIHNGIKLNDKVYNAVRICDPEKNGKGYPIVANGNIPANHIRMLDVTDQINDPKQNVIDQSISGSTGLIMAYAQSFLREELGKMYRGEIVLRGIPEIEPLDVLLMMDPSTGMQGPVEVETVTHVINAEEGYITIVKPRAVVCVNEAASANFFRMLAMAMGTVLPEIMHLKQAAGYAIGGAAGLGAATATGVAGGAVSTFGTGVSTVGQVGINTAARLLPLSDVLTAETATGIITSDIAAASTGSAIGELAASSLAVMSGPVGWAVLGMCAVAAAVGVWWFTNSTAKNNPLVICPCTKFGRPWVGGIEGWAINDLVGVARNKAMQFMADEVFPLLDAWRAFHGYQAPIPGTPAAQFGQPAPQVP